MREYNEDIHDELIPCSVEFCEAVVAANYVRLEHIPLTSDDQIDYVVTIIHSHFPDNSRQWAMATRMTKMPLAPKKRGRHVGYGDQAAKQIP
jgi:hypothetical protein